MGIPTRSTAPLAGSPRPAQVNVIFPKMDIFVRFEIWNLTSKRFEPVSNLPVDLMDSNKVFSNTRMETARTDGNGFIRFSMTETDLKRKSGEDHPDLYFNARCKGLTRGGVSLPDEWSTKKWNDKNGKPGYFEKAPFVAGGSLGGASAADPLVYRIGLDYHARFQFIGPKDSVSHLAPKGLKVGLRATSNIDHVEWQRTDANGEIHGLSFAAEGGESVSFQVEFNIKDPDINLPVATARTDDIANFWLTTFHDGDKKYFADNSCTSIGTQASPELFPCSHRGRNVALFFLTMLYEHATFFFHITDGAWTGVPDLELSKFGFGSSAYSWPLGEVHLTEQWWGDRSTLIHEISHQVMWKEVGISSLSIVGKIIEPQGLCMEHYENMVSNHMHAIIEGWAEVFEGIFEPSSLSLTPSSYVRVGERRVPLGPTPANQGMNVEGAFAQAIISIFQSYVVGSASTTPTIPRSVNGDVTQTAAWIKDPGVKARFRSAIWGPLHALSSSEPSTADFVAKMQELNPAVWPDMVTKLNAFNLAMDAPEIISISPTGGPVAGGQSITIEVSFFHPGGTQVTIGGHAVTAMSPAPSTSGHNRTTITCQTPPGSAGKVDVVVTTSAGSATLEKGYEYISLAPTIGFVVPASGPAAGGQHITIYGTNFNPDNTQVTIGGNVVMLFLPTPGHDRTTTIDCETPTGSGGIVDIVVTTATGSATLSAGYEYQFPTSSLGPRH